MRRWRAAAANNAQSGSQMCRQAWSAPLSTSQQEAWWLHWTGRRDRAGSSASHLAFETFRPRAKRRDAQRLRSGRNWEVPEPLADASLCIGASRTVGDANLGAHGYRNRPISSVRRTLSARSLPSSRRLGSGDRVCDQGIAREAGGRTIGIVAKRKPASTVSDEQSDRQLSAGASRLTGS